MKRIMFVCHGNICRSPMAEFVFKEIVAQNGMSDCFDICSRATSREEIWGNRGNPVYPPAAAELARHGLSCDGKYAQQVVSSDYERYDLFVLMDENNMRNIRCIFRDDPEQKICKLMDFTDRPGNVADPWYTGDFSKAFVDISEGCHCLFEKLIKN